MEKSKKGKNSDLKIKPKQGKYGCLVFAVIGNYQGKGRQRVILHEVEQSKKNPGEISYGHKRTWNFPVRGR